MPKIALLGDSIRGNYEPHIRKLAGDAADIRSPDENCRFSAYTLFNLAVWIPDDDYDVIHWNNGQWDTCYMPDGKIHTPLSQYLELQKRIADIALKRSKRAIFATTSPVYPEQFEKAERNGRKNEDIVEYNQRATEQLSAMGVEINDLHAALVQDVKTYICDDMVHLSEAGAARCAEQVWEMVGS
ncbi:MAG: SGNH/GDSL hydrolase family protein [Lentisphaerae bacterium]|jgi:hypothetical protein|nr:SGNH/GDSL hydrolase family protein [Lentisphaerota bacterium]MBT4817192.1 SGNH/GDSL hydrolase family protein [Lentisphaerota bacterium]MBT5609394.1 SGNH/GDSL hydrolase family protein [Lentisphaerota bacterium]MBT7057802.1 SGNH/GDSL hydrolase family protein [Lentisphaerota bacterium]MBT7843479.1 SGNH/GDSL hydrolase family protein [Lentisphaerota bacterium]